MNWAEKDDLSPQLDTFPISEDFEVPVMSTEISVPAAESAIDPHDLANVATEVVPFGEDGSNDTQPLFQSAATPELPATQTQSNTETSEPNASSPITEDTNEDVTVVDSSLAETRYPSRKRKSSTAPSSLPQSPSRALSQASSKASSKAGSKGGPQGSSQPNSPAASSRRKRSPSPPRKAAHNMIEKRYRSNLNDKIIVLRDAVPSLRFTAHRLEFCQSLNEPRRDGEEELSGLEPATKLNKATILGKAAEYIALLEKRNTALIEHNEYLKNQLSGMKDTPDELFLPVNDTPWNPQYGYNM
jgi:hypothetical protein